MYRFLDHTGELALEIEAPSPEEVFVQALEALAEVIRADEEGPPAAREVEVESPDRGTLLADWLSELVYLADAEGFIPEKVRSLELADATLRATVEGRVGRPSPLVKAVTYHGLELGRKGDGYYARVVFDV